MSEVAIWTIIVLTGIGTFALRLSLIQLFGSVQMPPRLVEALRFVPAAALAALVVPAIIYGGDAGASWTNPRLAAGILAAVAAWRTHSVFWTIGVGMGTLWLLKAMVGG